ncbi:MAG: hypothetical protein AAFR76_02995 [Planctomycetota bacterium]
MVPFWRRRLLAVTLPISLACASCWLVAATLATEQISLTPILPLGPWFKISTGAFASTALAFAMPVAATLLPIARPVRLRSLGVGGFASLTLGGVFVWLWIQAATMLAVSGLSGTLTTRLQVSYLQIGGLNFVGVTLLVVLWRSLKIRPREQALGALGRLACWIGVIACAFVFPFAATDLNNEPSGFARLALNATDMQWDTHRMSQVVTSGLHLFLGGALIACFARLLAERHCTHHAHHCYSCGYELIGVETYTCPECDHPITSEQRSHFAQLASNGSQFTSSSPTAST